MKLTIIKYIISLSDKNKITTLLLLAIIVISSYFKIKDNAYINLLNSNIKDLKKNNDICKNDLTICQNDTKAILTDIINSQKEELKKRDSIIGIEIAKTKMIINKSNKLINSINE